jgi:hypothetical protein
MLKVGSLKSGEASTGTERNSATQCGSLKTDPYALLCTFKSRRRASDLSGGM